MANTKITSAVIEAGAILNTHIASGAISSGHLSGINTGAVAEGSNLYYTDARAQTRARASISVTGGNLAYDSSTGVLQLTDNEIRDAISAGGNLSYNNSTGVMSYTTPTMYTDADAQGAITVTDAGGDGSLAYSGGTITYTGPSAAEVRAHLSAGTGVTYSSGAISIGQSVATTATPTFGNITTTGYIAGPASMVIDPAGVGDNTGTVVIAGNLQVDGTTTTINSTTVSIDDLNFTIASDAADSSAANGAGITIGGASATMLYTHATTSFDFNKPVNVTGAITGSIAASNINSGRLTDARMPTTIGASASTNFIGTFTGNANTASNTPVYGTGSNATHYITFAATNGGGNSSGAGSQARLSDGGLTYNPSTNALGVSGNISAGTISSGAITSTGLLTSVGGVINTNTGSNALYITRLGNTNESLKIHCDDRGAVFESIQDETADTYGNFIFAMDAGVTEPYFDVRKGTADNASIFRVDGGGNVGIGTAIPSVPLTVNNNTDHSDIAIFHAGGGTPNRGLKISTFSSTNSNAGVELDAQHATGAFKFSTGGTERMRITSTGEIVTGGLTSSTGQLHLYKADATGGKLVLQSQVLFV